ncbi:hypothetical protein [Streptomyces zagrosensis]|uniref:Sugar kinase n=1 Tax=Streptomyces zagrosensis TaxID=1042984 RepID=A0A7W9QBZ6_9ACTN|nr:hypothetical protein [Streptomyces zagrosensis]MBB5936232.1 hypothetical protein [Streptomyces zagrosensis]
MSDEPQTSDTPQERRRWPRAVGLFLLIAIPAGYMAISAQKSRGSGEDKQENAAATGLTHNWPSKVQRRIYDTPIPSYSVDVAYYETNSWKSSRMYVQFVTSAKGLDKFLSRFDVTRDVLNDGQVTIDEKSASAVGWKLDADKKWAGGVIDQKDPEPTLDITVDLDNPDHPKVYVISTVKP